MIKGYINRWEPDEDREKNLMHYWFCEDAKAAAYWDSRMRAEMDVSWFNQGISIPSSEGGSYTIRDFQVEELAPDKFVIFAVAPFIKTQRGTGDAQRNA